MATGILYLAWFDGGDLSCHGALFQEARVDVNREHPDVAKTSRSGFDTPLFSARFPSGSASECLSFRGHYSDNPAY